MKRMLQIATLACAASIPTLLATSAVGIAATTAAAGDDAPAAQDVEDLAREAVERNPNIEAMRARTRELTELADVASTWNDPSLSVGYLNAPVDSFRIDESPMSGVQFRLQQKLPEWGWTRASRAVAERQVERSRHARAEAESQLRRSVETLYWNLALSRQLERVTEAHVARTVELVRAVRARYEVGRAGQNALLRLEVLEQRLRDDLGDYVQAQRNLSAGLARALARASGETFETPAFIAAIPVEGDLENWMLLARSGRPELGAIREEVKERTDAAALSRAKVLPEVDVWVAYTLRTIDTVNDDGTDFFSAGVTIPIPVGSSAVGRRGEAANLAARDGARARLAAALDQIDAELISSDASWRRAYEKATRYESSLIPAARAALETALNDYAVDRAEFSALYEAEIDLLTLERAYLRASVDTLIQRAVVRATTGRVDLGDAS